MIIGYEDYRRCGFAIIGIHAMDENRNCTCGREDCQAAGKHPVMSNWQMGIQWEDDQVENMELMGHLKSFGVLTNGYLVVDIDPRNGGNEGYEELCKLIDMELQDESGFVVSTGGGGKHIYYKLPDGLRLKAHDKRFKGVDFKSSGFVIGCGSFHKSGNFYESDSGSPGEIRQAPLELIELLSRPDKIEYETFKLDGSDFTAKEISEMLDYITCGNEYSQWIDVGMAIHEATDGSGFDLWDSWSSRFSGYDSEVMDYKWHSFGKDGVDEKITAATIVYLATEGGWVRSVIFEATEEEINTLEAFERSMALGVGDCPINYKSVDVRYPPGFVGQITEWINVNCAAKREYLSALAAIHVMSMVAGASCDIFLTKRKAVPNLFSIGLAGSGSGKGDVLSAMQHIIERVGLSKTVSGKIRSERSIYEGLSENQMFNLIMDEIGIKLGSVVGQKVSEYNMATAGAIMESYTADVLYCDQRVTRDVISSFSKHMTQLITQIEENELNADKDEVIAQFKTVISRIDGAIKNPFFSIFGVSTDDQFKKLITEENIKSGLMGRAMIMQELQEIPEKNKDYQPSDLPNNILLKLSDVIHNGSFGEYFYPQSIIRSSTREVRASPKVQMMAEKFFDWLDEIARKHVENGTGYHPLINRCAVKVAKIAGILAAYDKVISEEHLRYAVALTIKSTSDLMMRADSLSGSKSKAMDERIEGIFSMVKEYVKRGMTKTAIVRGVAKDGGYKRADVERTIERLISDDIISIDNDAKRTSHNVIIYKLSNDEAEL